MNKLIHLLNSLIVKIHRKMSETNSDSTESNDNNMSLYYNHYLRLPHGSPNEEDNEMEIVSSSASFEDSSSGIDGEVRFLTLIICFVFINFILLI